MPIYEVENIQSYYKSSADNIVFGQSKPNIGDTSWIRLVVGSKVSGSYEELVENIYSRYLFDHTNPFFRSGEVRNIRLFSNSQTIQDSKMPDILGLYQTGSYGSGSLVLMPTNARIVNGQYTYSMLFSRDGHTITGSNSQRVNNIEWCNSYPFEKKYESISRVEPANYNIKFSYTEDTTKADIFQAQSSNLIPTVPNYSFILAETITGSNDKKYISYNYNCYCFLGIPNLLFFFGGLFGDDRSKNNFVFGINPTTNLVLTAGTTGSLMNYVTGSSIGYSAEGWKYGIYNAIPTNFSVVYRQSHYGQYRDMLEQRIYTKTFNNPSAGGPLDTNGGINFITGSSLSGESDNWLTSSIYNSSDMTEAYRVNPYGSGIFDREYKSSQPWYDNDPRLGT